MRKLVPILTAFAFVLLVRPAFAAGSGEKAVLAALAAWKEAMLKKDRAALEKIFHPELNGAGEAGAGAKVSVGPGPATPVKGFGRRDAHKTRGQRCAATISTRRTRPGDPGRGGGRGLASAGRCRRARSHR